MVGDPRPSRQSQAGAAPDAAIGRTAIYQRPNTSKPAAAHKIYPYLLGGLAIERVNQVWCSDVTYIPMAKGFLYLVVIMDWVSRAVLAWRLSNTLSADFCVEALEEALSLSGRPDIFNTDQGSQGGFKWSSQHDLCWPIEAIGQGPLQAFSNQASFEAGS